MITHLAALLAASAGSATSPIGTCSFRLTPARGIIAMRIDYVDPNRPDRDGGADIKKAASFFGIDPSQLITRGQAITAHVRRDAGTFRCVAQTTGSGAKGALYFDSDQAYVNRLRRLGMWFSGSLRYDLMTAAVADVSAAYAAAIASQNYHLPVQELAAFRILGVTPEYVRGLRSATTRSFSAKEIEDLSVMRVDGSYIASLASVGYKNLSANDLMSLKSINVTASYVRKLEAHGLGHPTVYELIRLKKDSGSSR